jgi:hypothetical protein
MIFKKKTYQSGGGCFWLLEVNVHPEEKLPKARSSYFSYFFSFKIFCFLKNGRVLYTFEASI